MAVSIDRGCTDFKWFQIESERSAHTKSCLNLSRMSKNLQVPVGKKSLLRIQFRGHTRSPREGSHITLNESQ